MPKAHEVAAALRTFADRLDLTPDAIVSRPFVSFSRDYGKDDKEKFLNVAKALPRPFTKEWSGNELQVIHDNPAAYIYARIDRSDVCELVEPAKPAVYRCDPILSEEEDAELENSNG